MFSYGQRSKCADLLNSYVGGIFSRCYKELSLLRKNGKMNINKGKDLKAAWIQTEGTYLLFRKSAVDAFPAYKLLMRGGSL